LKYALSYNEVTKIVKDKEGLIKIDNKIRRDPKFPLGIMDVVSIDKTSQHFRILYDVKGRFMPHKIDAKEASLKLCRVVRKCLGKNKIPYIVTHDGRTIRFPHPDIKKNDSIKLNLETGEIDGVVKQEQGAKVILTGGNNIGRIGTLQHIEKAPGSYSIAHIVDSRGHTFSTRLENVFVIGTSKKAVISLPKGEGIKLNLLEERDTRQARQADDDEDEDDDDE